MQDPALLAYVMNVYNGSDGDATKGLYQRLETLGPRGIIAMNLFRAHKNSSRAKVYRGGIRGKGSFKGMAYDRKRWAMDNLAKILIQHAEACGIVWGWGLDRGEAKHKVVLYVEIPTGQVSFHTDFRGHGPDYNNEWDGVRGAGVGRICSWTVRLLQEEQERVAS